ncbi:papi [Carabus blaptoides fortunei]
MRVCLLIVSSSFVTMADIEKLKRETQSLLSSLIISSAKGLTVRRLRKDYNDEIGEDVPFRKLGYPNFNQFLFSIPETCRVIGSGDNATVAPVITDKTKHINDMIMKQRPPRPNRHNYRASKRSAGVYSGKYQQPTLSRPVYNVPINLPVFNANAHKRTLPPPPEYLLEERQKHSRFVPPRMYRQNITANTTMTDNVLPVSPANCNSQTQVPDVQKQYEEMKPTSCDTGASIHTTVKNEDMSVNCTKSNAYATDTFHDEYNDESYFIDDDGFDYTFMYSSEEEETREEGELDVACSAMNLLRITSKEEEAQLRNADQVTSRIESRVNDRVKEKLRTLISEHADGIWCSKLIKLYNERFKQKLDPLDYGFASVIEMCEDVRDVFHILRPNRTDWKLFDKRNPIPNIETSADFTKYLLAVPMDLACSSNTEPALPENYTHPLPQFQYPEGVLHPGDEILRQWLVGGERVNSYIDVIVAEVYDPSKFWIHLRGEQTSEALSTLMDEMQAFYQHNAQTLRLSLLSTRIGLYCVAPFMKEYHRAMIIKIYDDETVKVFYIDYGTIAEVQVRRTCFLHHDFARLPAQAIRARLANIIPAQQNTMWPREATRCMMRLIMEKDLVALISAIDYEQQILKVFLTDTSLPDVDIHINDVLINEGYALVGKEAPLCDTSLAVVPNVHLYPTFPEIEHGVYPSIGDVVRLLKLGQTYEQIFRGYYQQETSSPAPLFYCSSALDFNQMSSSRCSTQYDQLVTTQPLLTAGTDMEYNLSYSTENIGDGTTSVLHTNEYGDNILSDSVPYTTDSNDCNTVSNDMYNQTNDSSSIVEGNSPSTDTHTDMQDVATSPMHDNQDEDQQKQEQLECIDTEDSHTETYTFDNEQYKGCNLKQTAVQKPPPGFENVQPGRNHEDNALLLLNATYPDLQSASSLLGLSQLQYPLQYYNTSPMLGGIGVYNSYLVAQYLQQQQYYQAAVQHCQVLEQAQRLAAMQQQQQQRTKSPHHGRRSPIISPETEQDSAESLTDSKQKDTLRHVVELKINDSVIHILKIDDELYVVSQEILTNLLKTNMSLKMWLTDNRLDMNTFPNKLVNILAYQHVYKQIQSFSIPGVYPPNNLGCNLRLTLLTDVVNIVKEYGSQTVLNDLLTGMKHIWSRDLWTSLNSTE